MRWPLRYQILAPFAAVMLLASAGVSLLDAYLAARSTERHIESQLREVARTLLESNFPLTDRVLRQTHGLSGAEFVLTTESGRVLATSLGDASDFLNAGGNLGEAGSVGKGGGGAPPAADELGDAFSLGSVESIAGVRYFHQVVAVGPRARRRRRIVRREPVSTFCIPRVSCARRGGRRSIRRCWSGA